MKRYRFQYDPVIWIIFAVAVAVPSVEYAQLRRAREAAPRAAVAPASTRLVQPAGEPKVAPAAPQPAPAPSRDVTPPERVATNVDSTSVAPPSDPKPTAAPDLSRYAPVGPASTRIAVAARAAGGDLAAVLEESGRVTVWNLDLQKQVVSFETGLRPAVNFSGPPPPLALVSVPGTASPPFVAIGGLDGRIHMWDAVTGAKVPPDPQDANDPARTRMTGRPLLDVAWTGLTEVMSLDADFTLAAWRATPGLDSGVVFMALSRTGQSPGGWAKDIDYSMDGRLLAVAAMGGLHLLEEVPLQWTLVDTSGAESDAEYRARAKAAKPGARVLRRWGTYPYKVAFAPGGRLVASAWSNQEIRVHSTGITAPAAYKSTSSSSLRLTRLRTMQIPESWTAWSLTFSPDGKLLAASGFNTIYVWSLADGTQPLALKVPRGPVHTLWFAPHGRSLVVAGYGDTYLREIALPEGW